MDNKGDDIVDLRTRMQAASKPVMRVNLEDLRAGGGGVAGRIPAFLAELERANRAQSSSTPTVDDPASSGFELDEDGARDQVHVEMEIVAGILEEKKPGNSATHSPRSGSEESDEFSLAMPPAGSIASAVGGSGRQVQIRPVGSDAKSSSSTSPDEIRPTIDLRAHRPRADSSSSSGSSSSGTSSGSDNSRGTTGRATTSQGSALSPSPVPRATRTRSSTQNRTQSPASVSPMNEESSGLPLSAAEGQPSKKTRKTRKLIEEVE